MTVAEFLIIAYIVSVLIAGIAYTKDFIEDIRNDIKNSKQSYYRPTVTIGNVLARLGYTSLPILNTVASIFFLCVFLSWTWNSFFPNLFRIPLIQPKTKT